MSVAVVAPQSAEELAVTVHGVLCERDSLDPAQTPLFRTPLLRRGKVCGAVFHIEGPRLLRTSAVWSSEADRVIFYDSVGVRFHEVRVADATGDVRGAA